MPGRSASLHNNRIYLDPLALRQTATSGQVQTVVRQLAIRIAGHEAPITTIGQASVGAGNVPPSNGPVMIVYHGFYPVDDVARRRATIGATDREFHLLAMGVLIPAGREAAPGSLGMSSPARARISCA